MRCKLGLAIFIIGLCFTTWLSAANITITPKITVTAMINVDGTLYAGGNTGAGVYKLVNGAWVGAGMGLPYGITIYSLLNVDGTMYAGGDKQAGVYKLVNDTWVTAGTGLQGIAIHSLSST